MKLVLVTGMSGAGKSVALKTLEDCGFEAIDNMPLAYLPNVAAAANRNLVIGSDVRSRDYSADHFLNAIAPLRANPDIDFKLLFLDCEDEVLQRRYTETRRRHPMALDRSVADGIQAERALLNPLRDAADLLIDTSEYPVTELRKAVTAFFASGERELSVTLTSFSFKRGVPREADMVFDVRFLKNPYYEPALQPLTGLDPRVGAHVESDKGFKEFYSKLSDLITSLLPRYMDEGKHYLTIAVGCTGGKHRSVHIVQKLGGFLQAEGYNVTLRHRDMERI